MKSNEGVDLRAGDKVVVCHSGDTGWARAFFGRVLKYRSTENGMLQFAGDAPWSPRYFTGADGAPIMLRKLTDIESEAVAWAESFADLCGGLTFTKNGKQIRLCSSGNFLYIESPAPADPEKDYRAIADGLRTENAQLRAEVDGLKAKIAGERMGARADADLREAMSDVLRDIRAALDAKEGEHIVEVAKHRMAVLRAGGMERYSVEAATCARENSEKFHAVLQKAAQALGMRAGDDVVQGLLPAIEQLQEVVSSLKSRLANSADVRIRDAILRDLRFILGAKENEDIREVAKQRMAVLRDATADCREAEARVDAICNELQAEPRNVVDTARALVATRTPAHEVARLKSCEEAWYKVNAALREAAPSIGRATGAETAVARVAHLVANQFDPFKVSNAQCDRVYSIFKDGSLTRERGGTNPHPARSVASMLHSFGWVQRDLRLALDAASPRGAVYKPAHGGRPTPSNEPCELAGAGAALGLHEPAPKPRAVPDDLYF